MKVSDISESFGYTENGFEISGVPMENIARNVDTPFFVYDTSVIKRQYENLRNNLPENVDIFYAMKANSHSTIVKYLNDLGAGIEVASKGELYTCEKAGVNPKDIVFAGPGKSNDDLEKAIDMGIYSINAESVHEIKRINRIGGKRKKNVDVSLRINPKFIDRGDFLKHAASLTMAGEPQKFGIDSERVCEVVNYANKLENINLKGVHIFSATGIKDEESFLKNLESNFSIAADINRERYYVTSVNVGGGLPIPYSDEDKELSIKAVGKKIKEMKRKHKFLRNNEPRIIIEPGRYLVGQSGIYVTKVEDVKYSKGEDYVITNGGINHLLRPALIESHHPIFNLSKNGELLKKKTFDVGGPLCTPLDSFGDANLPKHTKRGELIGVFNAGAYGFTEAMPHFLKHDTAAEVLVHDGSYHLIRKSKSAESFVDEEVTLEGLNGRFE